MRGASVPRASNVREGSGGADVKGDGTWGQDLAKKTPDEVRGRKSADGRDLSRPPSRRPPFRTTRHIRYAPIPPRAQVGSGICEDNPATTTCLSAPLDTTTGYADAIDSRPGPYRLSGHARRRAAG